MKSRDRLRLPKTIRKTVLEARSVLDVGRETPDTPPFLTPRPVAMKLSSPWWDSNPGQQKWKAGTDSTTVKTNNARTTYTAKTRVSN